MRWADGSDQQVVEVRTTRSCRRCSYVTTIPCSGTNSRVLRLLTTATLVAISACSLLAAYTPLNPGLPPPAAVDGTRSMPTHLPHQTPHRHLAVTWYLAQNSPSAASETHRLLRFDHTRSKIHPHSLDTPPPDAVDGTRSMFHPAPSRRLRVTAYVA